MIRPVSREGRIETGGTFSPIVRQRVVERIRDAASQRIVVIIAPAGYGKSVAIRQYLDFVAEPHVRFDVRSDNSTLLGFLRGFTDSLAAIAPDARATLTEAYEANGASATLGDDLAMWLHAHIKSYTGTVVIDDLHVTEGNPEVCRFLTSLIQRAKGRSRWIIASRSTLELPIGTWLAYGDMGLNVDEQDLRFTIDEAREAAKIARVAVRDEELREILAMTEGWPTALSFALRSSTRSADLRNVAATTRDMIYRYLAEQVYRSLLPEERELLHFACFLDAIDIEILRCGGYEKAKATIEALRERVAFIYADRPNVYGCHDLFRDFTRHQLELQGDSAVNEMRLRVATALEAANKPELALGLHSDRSAWGEVLRILETSGIDLLEHGHSDAVHRAVSGLPQDVRATNASVLGIRGLIEADRGKLDRAESLLQRAISRTDDAVAKARIGIRLGILLVNQMRDVGPLLEPLLTRSLPVGLRAEVSSLLAVSYAYCDRRTDAKSALASADRYSREVDNEPQRARILQRIGIAASRLGLPMERALAAQTDAASLASSHGLFGLAGRAFSALASIALFYESDAAREVWYAQQALNASSKAGDRVNIQTAILQLIDIEGRRGNLERIKALEQQLASAATTDTQGIVYVIPVRAFCAAWDGRFADAHRLMKSVAGNSRLFDFDRNFNAAVDALFLLADGNRDEALAVVKETLPRIDRLDTPVPYGKKQNAIARLLCACVEALAGRRINSQRILRNCDRDHTPIVAAVRDCVLAISRIVKNNSHFSDLRERLDTLSSMGGGGLARVLELVVEERSVDDGLETDGLTQTELAILKALGDGQSPKDISREGGRSVYTIQAHIRNITKKLNCSGRNEALAIARSRGLIA